MLDVSAFSTVFHDSRIILVQRRSTHLDAPVDHIVVGVIRGVRGLRGELRVEITTEFPQRFDPGATLFISGIKREVLKSSRDRKGVLLFIQGINSREDAEACKGMELSVPECDSLERPEGKYFHYELIGLKTYDEDGKYLGELTEIIETGANDVYAIALDGYKDLLLPVIPEVIGSIDVKSSRIEVKVPLGLER